MKIIKFFIAGYILIFASAFNVFAQNIASDEDFYRAAESSNYSAIAFYKIIERRDDKANIYFSPYALYAACSILFEGTTGKTYDNFLNAFDFPDDLVKRREIFASWIKSKEKAVIKNYFWLSNNYQYLNAYKRVLEKYYFADFNAKINFTKKSVFNKINKKIGGIGARLSQENAFGENAQAVLANVVNFYGKWKEPFEKTENLDEDFYLS
ncbi:MAG: hypothetical protein LBO62_07255, partial [Endomicrobium sp.]|nr:hypothetical protein [Endomicrobium sp.]